MKESITLTLTEAEVKQAVINYITKQGYEVNSVYFTLASDSDDGPGYPSYTVNGASAQVTK